MTDATAITPPPFANSAASPLPRVVGRRRGTRVVRIALTGYLCVGMTALVAVVGGCVGAPKAENLVATEEDLSTEQEAQNVISFPFRVAGGVVVYPLKFLFHDLPNEISSAFEDELASQRKKLASERPVEREIAVAELAEIGTASAVPLLVAAFADSDAAVRRDAVLAFAKFSPAVVREGENHLKPAIPVAQRLRQMLRDNDPLIRAGAAMALAQIGDTPDIEALRVACDIPGEDEGVVSFMILARGRLGDSAAQADALAMVADFSRHPLTHANALMALAHLGGPAGERELRRALAHPDDRVVIAAVTGLGVMRDFGLLMTLARDGTPLQRQKSLIALGEFGGQDFVAVLERYRQSDDPEIRVAAILGLAQAGYPRCVPYLVELLHERDPMTRLHALTFLMRMTRKDFGLDPTPWSDWWNHHGGGFVENQK